MDRRSDYLAAGVCGCLELDEHSGENCATCRFSACLGCTYPQELYCRRHAPIRDVERDCTTWPMVSRRAWCGDYERRYVPSSV
jgi:hypothetical protein